MVLHSTFWCPLGALVLLQVLYQCTGTMLYALVDQLHGPTLNLLVPYRGVLVLLQVLNRYHALCPSG
jgi:hypothetical protein